jgi:hypothetical protein
MQRPPAVTVTSQIPAGDCASNLNAGDHVVAAYLISSAQLKIPPISDSGPLSRQPGNAVWRMCYVVGPNAAISYGGGGNERHALDIYYRNGALAEVIGQDIAFRFKMSGALG